RRELDHAAIGFDLAKVRDVGALDLAGDVEGEQAVAVQVDGEGLRAGQHDVAELGGNGAGVPHLRRDEGGEAVIGDSDGAVVHPLRIRIGRGNREVEAAVVEIAVADVGGGGDEAVDVDLRAPREEEAVRIDQGDIAVRAQSPGDARRIRA